MGDGPPGDRRAETRDPGLIEGIRIDLVRLRRSWMGLLFPRQRGDAHSVLGRWTPATTLGSIKYRAWMTIGIPLIALLYPLAVIGFAARFYARRIDRSAASIGILGVFLLSVIVWGSLAVVASVRFTYDGFVAVVAAGGVAVVSAVIARLFARRGRIIPVIFGYPFGVTALFLPPVVAALYSPALADVIYPRSQYLARWVLDNVLDVYGLDRLIRHTFELEGLAYVAMWFALAVPIGWFIGITVGLANLVRPSGPAGEDDRTGD